MEDADCDLRDADYWSKPRRFPMCAAAAVGRRSLSQFPFPGVVEQASGKSRSAKCRHLGIPGSGTRFQAQWPCCRLLVPPLALCPPYDIAPQTPGWGLALPSSVPPPIDNPKPGSSAPVPSCSQPVSGRTSGPVIRSRELARPMNLHRTSLAARLGQPDACMPPTAGEGDEVTEVRAGRAGESLPGCELRTTHQTL